MEAVVSSVVSLCIGFVLGLVSERHKQVVTERAKMLSEVSAWVNDLTTLIHCLGEDLANLSQGREVILLPDFKSRQLLSQKLATSTPRIKGIVQSGSLRTLTTRSLVRELDSTLGQMHQFVTAVIIPAHVALTAPGFDPFEEPERVAQMVLQCSHGDAIAQAAQALLAKLSTSLW